MKSKAFRTIFDDFESMKIRIESNRIESNRIESKSSKNRIDIDSISRWQKSNRTESLRNVVVLYFYHHDDLNKSITSIFSIEIVIDFEE